MTASTRLTTIGTAITAIVATLQVNGQAINALDYEPGFEGLPGTPAGTVAFLNLTRPLLHEGESILGTDDWDSSWRVRVYFDLDNAAVRERVLREVAADIVLAFNADPSLGGLALDSVITNVEAGEMPTDTARPLTVLESELDVRRLVNDLYH